MESTIFVSNGRFLDFTVTLKSGKRFRVHFVESVFQTSDPEKIEAIKSHENYGKKFRIEKTVPIHPRVFHQLPQITQEVVVRDSKSILADMKERRRLEIEKRKRTSGFGAKGSVQSEPKLRSGDNDNQEARSVGQSEPGVTEG